MIRVFVQKVKATDSLLKNTNDWFDLDCMTSENASSVCLGSTIQLQHLAQSIRQLVIDSKVWKSYLKTKDLTIIIEYWFLKQIATHSTRPIPCTCPIPASTLPITTLSTTINPPYVNYDMTYKKFSRISFFCYPLVSAIQRRKRWYRW